MQKSVSSPIKSILDKGTQFNKPLKSVTKKSEKTERSKRSERTEPKEQKEQSTIENSTEEPNSTSNVNKNTMINKEQSNNENNNIEIHIANGTVSQLSIPQLKSYLKSK